MTATYDALRLFLALQVAVGLTASPASAVSEFPPIALTQLDSGAGDTAPPVIVQTYNSDTLERALRVGRTVEDDDGVSHAVVTRLSLAGEPLWEQRVTFVPGANERLVGLDRNGVVVVGAIPNGGGAERTFAALVADDGAVTNSTELLLFSDGGTFTATHVCPNAFPPIVVGEANGRLLINRNRRTKGVDVVLFSLAHPHGDPEEQLTPNSGAIALGLGSNDDVVDVDCNSDAVGFEIVLLRRSPAGPIDRYYVDSIGRDDLHATFVKKASRRLVSPVNPPRAISAASFSETLAPGIYVGGVGGIQVLTPKGKPSALIPLDPGAVVDALYTINNLVAVGTTAAGYAGIPGHGGTDVFVAAFNPEHTLKWVDVLGTPQDDASSAVELFPGEESSFVTAGVTKGSLDGIAPADPDGDAFVAIYERNTLARPPSQPLNFAAEAGATTVTFSWDPPAQTDGVPVTYVLEVRDNTKTIATVATSTTSAAIPRSKFKIGRQHLATVKARSEAGASFFAILAMTFF